MAQPFVLSVSRVSRSVVVTLRGELDYPVSAQLAEVLADLIDGQGNLVMVVDVRDLHRVDPAGLGVLADAAHAVEGRGGGLRLSAPNRAVGDALRLAGLARLIDPASPSGQVAQPSRFPHFPPPVPIPHCSHPAGTNRVPHITKGDQ